MKFRAHNKTINVGREVNRRIFLLFSASFDSAVLYWTAIATATATAAFCVVILYFGSSLDGF